MSDDSFSVHIKSELQYDFDAQESAFPSGSISAIAVTTSARAEPLLNVYYINNESVFNAFQDPTLATTGSPPWDVTNMYFRAFTTSNHYQTSHLSILTSYRGPIYHSGNFNAELHSRHGHGSHPRWTTCLHHRSRATLSPLGCPSYTRYRAHN